MYLRRSFYLAVTVLVKLLWAQSKVIFEDTVIMPIRLLISAWHGLCVRGLRLRKRCVALHALISKKLQLQFFLYLG